jgi:uncharacterized protein YjdB
VVGNQVHAVGVGSVAMTVTAGDDGKTGSFTVTILKAVTGIKGGPDITLRVGDQDVEPAVTVSPPDASVKSWHLASVDPDIASVNGTFIHAVSRGDTKVAVISDDNPSITDTVRVSVRASIFGP